MADPRTLEPDERRAALARSTVKSADHVAQDPALRAAQDQRVAAVEELAGAFGIDTADPATRRGLLLAVAITANAEDLRAALGAITEAVARWTERDGTP